MKIIGMIPGGVKTISVRNTAIERFRYIAALLVIGIHTGIFSDVNDILCFSVVQIICRVAVPFFAVCSGYFLGAKASDPVALKGSVKRQWIKLVMIYAAWTILYMLYSIPSWKQTGWFSAWAFVDYAIGAVRSGSHYHLWYVLSMIYALPLFWLLTSRLKQEALLRLSALLYMVKVLKYGYQRWMPLPVKNLFAYMDKVPAITDAVILLLPLLLLGEHIYFRSAEKRSLKPMLGLLISSFLLTVEAFGLRHAGQENVSFIIFTYPTAYFLFQIILKTENVKNEKLWASLGAASLFIYCFHPMAVETFAPLFKNTVLTYVFTAVISTGFSIVYIKVMERLRRRKSCSA